MRVTEKTTSPLAPARMAAYRVLEKVIKGEYASDALRDTTRNLASRDAGLASQIVFGCLRFQAQLDFLIEHYSGRPLHKLDVEVALSLRGALFQMRYLERIPEHAAVHDAVEYVKRRKKSAAPFVNAVLRKVDRQPIPWPDEPTALSFPGWLFERWRVHFGMEAARAGAVVALREPQQYVRVPPGQNFPSSLRAVSTDVPGAYRLLEGAPPDSHPPDLQALRLRLQDIGSQAIVALLDLRPTDTFLDLCAAPGNKTEQALETKPKFAVACDVSYRRLLETPPACPRVVLDATQRLPFNRRFSRILIDAPCSGTGTLARNPEIKWRLQPDDLDRYHKKQSQILREAFSFLEPAGRLVYATCSLEREENEDVVTEFLASQPEAVCMRQMWRIPGRDEGDGFYGAVLENRKR